MEKNSVEYTEINIKALNNRRELKKAKNERF